MHELIISIDLLRAAQLFDVAQYDKQQEEVNIWIFTLAPLAPAPLQSFHPVIPSFLPEADSAFHSIGARKLSSSGGIHRRAATLERLRFERPK